MPPYAFIFCDVFTDRPLAGNQLAVFPRGADVPESVMQPLAREINFSETVYCLDPEKDGDVRVRIFTPRVELPFAGHPVLGTAAVVAGARQEVALETGMGVVPVSVQPLGSNGGPAARWRAAMDQPIPTVEPWPDPDALLAALGVRASVTPVLVYDNGVRHVYVGLESAAEVGALTPDLRQLEEVAPGTGVNCFSPLDRPGPPGPPGVAQWKTRMFGPGLGVDEDPGTGSAAGPLALHLCRHGLAGLGIRVELSQGDELGRPSRLWARVTGSADAPETIEVGGTVVSVARGEVEL